MEAGEFVLQKQQMGTTARPNWLGPGLTWADLGSPGALTMGRLVRSLWVGMTWPIGLWTGV
jgi:hypothetical protein